VCEFQQTINGWISAAAADKKSGYWYIIGMKMVNGARVREG
jgi:hypothetical protein